MSKNKKSFPRISLAPIHEYTDAPFRILCQKHGCEAIFVPLINVTAVTKGKLIPDIHESEREVYVQLSGSNPKEFAETVKIVSEKFQNIAGFNINAGCPSHTTMKIGAGSALMKNLELLSKIIVECKKVTSLPVSVKTRIFTEVEKTISFYKGIESAGADFIITHGRTVKQGYSGKSNWKIISDAHKALSIPVIGNGDIQNLDQAESLIENSCDGIMIGRAALQNPMVFKGKKELSQSERKNLFLEYCEICDSIGVINLKDLKLVSAQLLKGIKDAARVREKIMKSKKLEDVFNAVEFS